MAQMKKCPVCGISVKLENLTDHLEKVHPKAKVDLKLTQVEEEEIKRAEKREKVAMRAGEKKIYASVAIIIVIILLFAVFYHPPSVGPQVGKEAPNFSLKDIDGNTIRLEDYRGKVVLLEFMDPDCGVCERVAPTMVSIHTNYGAQIEIISIDADIIGAKDNIEKILTFKSKYGTTWTYALDTASVTSLYGVTATPTDFVLDKNGVVTYRHSGYFEYQTLAYQIDKALAS